MGLLSQRDVLGRLSHNELAPFEARFSSAEDIDAQLSQIISDAIPPSNDTYKKISAYLKSTKAVDSQTAKDAARVGDHHLRVIFNAIANAGLHAFAPDVFGNVESLYNLLHEHFAIHTFRSIASAWAYSSIYKINMALIHDYNLLRSFYRSFIFGHMKEQAQREDRKPGRVAQRVVANNAYRRREEVCFYICTLLSAAGSCFFLA